MCNCTSSLRDLDSTEEIGGVGKIRLNDSVLLALATLKLLLLGLVLGNELRKQEKCRVST